MFTRLCDFEILDLMSLLIQTSKKSIIPEMMTVYSIIWKKLKRTRFTNHFIKIPVMLSDSERINLIRSIYLTRPKFYLKLFLI